MKKKILKQSICARCGKPSVMPYVCKEHDKELETLCKRLNEFHIEIRYGYMRGTSVLRILERIKKRMSQLKTIIEEIEDEEKEKGVD